MDEKYEEYVIVYNGNIVLRDPFDRPYIYQTKEEALYMLIFISEMMRETARVRKLSETVKITNKELI
jgi:hypothetical protein